MISITATVDIGSLVPARRLGNGLDVFLLRENFLLGPGKWLESDLKGTAFLVWVVVAALDTIWEVGPGK